MNGRAETRAIARRAFVDSLPVLMGYTTMGFVAGVLLAAKGGVALAPLWGFLTATLWVTGTMNFAFVPLIAAREPLAALATMTLLVNFRYAFYGFSLLDRWRDVPFLRKCYLILLLADENYALEAAHKAKDRRRYAKYCTCLSLMNHGYWIAGVTSGTLAVCALGMVLDPEAIRRATRGMDFAMTALFLVIFTDQMREFFANGK